VIAFGLAALVAGISWGLGTGRVPAEGGRMEPNVPARSSTLSVPGSPFPVPNQNDT